MDSTQDIERDLEIDNNHEIIRAVNKRNKNLSF
jgi:hypothetical protein